MAPYTSPQSFHFLHLCGSLPMTSQSHILYKQTKTKKTLNYTKCVTRFNADFNWAHHNLKMWNICQQIPTWLTFERIWTGWLWNALSLLDRQGLCTQLTYSVYNETYTIMDQSSHSCKCNTVDIFILYCVGFLEFFNHQVIILKNALV